MKDLFSQNETNKNNKHILIMGRAGIGKTTLCKKMLYEWRTRNMWRDCEMLFFLKLRNLLRYDKKLLENMELAEIIVNECLVC